MNQIVITLAQLFGEIYFNKICNFQQKEMVKSNPYSFPYHPLYSDLQQLIELLNYSKKLLKFLLAMTVYTNYIVQN